jgi:putative DNA primase/helicase
MHVDFRGHAREDRITKMAPVAYQPGYVSPLWSAFTGRFLPDQPVHDFAQTFHGIGITGLRVQALVYHYGGGANGKSVAMEVMARVLGQYVQMLPVEALSGDGQRRSDQATPEFARLPGARVVRVSELPKGFKLKEALIKALTGGEPILARHLNKGFFEFQPVFKPVLSSNHKPEIYGTDHGIWRRMNLVPWTVTIPEAEQRSFDDVVAEMVAEGSGVLNWLITGLGRYIAEGLRAPEAVKVATNEHRSDMDPVARFVTHCVGVLTLTDEFKAELEADDKLEPPENVRVYARDMHQAFNRWMDANGQKPWGETAFGRQMGERAEQFGFKRYDKRVRYFAPVSLHDVPEAVERPMRGRDEPPPHDGDGLPDI